MTEVLTTRLEKTFLGWSQSRPPTPGRGWPGLRIIKQQGPGISPLSGEEVRQAELSFSSLNQPVAQWSREAASHSLLGRGNRLSMDEEGDVGKNGRAGVGWFPLDRSMCGLPEDGNLRCKLSSL